MGLLAHGVVTASDNGVMEVGRLISTSASDGVLSLAALLVVFMVLGWALVSPVWNVQDGQAAPAGGGPSPGGARLPGGPGDATSGLARPGYAGGQPVGRAAGLVRPPKVAGSPPWGPAPMPPGLRPR